HIYLLIPSTFTSFLPFYRSRPHRDLHSFPTRRSSDLQTPTGTFSIQRRVQDETMDSGTLGVDPHGPGGYHLEHVLNTQYFTSDGDRKSTRLNSSHLGISYAVFCLKKKKKEN